MAHIGNKYEKICRSKYQIIQYLVMGNYEKSEESAAVGILPDFMTMTEVGTLGSEGQILSPVIRWLRDLNLRSEI